MWFICPCWEKYGGVFEELLLQRGKQSEGETPKDEICQEAAKSCESDAREAHELILSKPEVGAILPEAVPRAAVFAGWQKFWQEIQSPL